jgi:hypothetical protein
MRAKARAIGGAIMNIILFEIRGIINSFENSFRASANGWVNPIRDTLFGPLRSWE